MNLPFYLGPVAALVGLLSLQPALARDVAAPTEHQSWLTTYRTAHSRAMLEEDVDGTTSRHAESFRLIPPYHGTVQGRANARAYYAALFARFDLRRYQREVVKVYDLGSRLIEAGRLTMTLALVNDPTPHQITGGYMDIWEMGAGKPASLITHVWNTDGYPAIADSLRFRDVAGVRTAFEARVPIKDNPSFELAALNKLLEVAISQADHRIWAQFFAGDAVLLANHHGLVLGRPAIDQYLARHTADLPVFEKLDIRNDAIDPVGRFVIEYASHVANWRNGDSSGVNTGKDVRVWRREADGSLKMICGIGTYD